jgi:hypothetical protein
MNDPWVGGPCGAASRISLPLTDITGVPRGATLSFRRRCPASAAGMRLRLSAEGSVVVLLVLDRGKPAEGPVQASVV